MPARLLECRRQPLTLISELGTTIASQESSGPALWADTSRKPCSYRAVQVVVVACPCAPQDTSLLGIEPTTPGQAFGPSPLCRAASFNASSASRRWIIDVLPALADSPTEETEVPCACRCDGKLWEQEISELVSLGSHPKRIDRASRDGSASTHLSRISFGATIDWLNVKVGICEATLCTRTSIVRARQAMFRPTACYDGTWREFLLSDTSSAPFDTDHREHNASPTISLV